MSETALLEPRSALMSADDVQSVQTEYVRATVKEWSALCQRFFSLERREMLRKEPAPGDLATHRHLVKWLIQGTKLLQVMAEDPDLADRSMARELSGRLLQLEAAWSQFQDPMPSAEAEALLAKIFPE